jgi:hypothetical protein
MIAERISFYIGDTKGPFFETPVDHKTGYDVPICIEWENYKMNYSSIHPGTQYPIDIARFMKPSKMKKLWFVCGDYPYTGPNFPVFTKVRDTLNPESKGIIGNLDSNRHWGDIFKHEDPPWEMKKSDIIWRGADTSRGLRLNFVKKFQPLYNVGFSSYVQDALKEPHLYKKEYIRGSLSISDMLKYKYLPVVDGNDKASSLNWVLASNSVPLMPIPRFHSWVCEKFLKPGKHFVEVKPDFSDLPEKLDWCRANDEECKQIALEGSTYMSQFMNKNIENYIESKLVQFAET